MSIFHHSTNCDKTWLATKQTNKIVFWQNTKKFMCLNLIDMYFIGLLIKVNMNDKFQILPNRFSLKKKYSILSSLWVQYKNDIYCMIVLLISWYKIYFKNVYIQIINSTSCHMFQKCNQKTPLLQSLTFSNTFSQTPTYLHTCTH